ncbi:MAG: hypothetical protein IAE83_00360, partial [Anaerolinea sp.]|nr:hypothetical protein [Anaerolinea sp.]
ANPANLTDPAGTCVDPLSFIVCAAAVVLGGLYLNEWRGNVYANQMQGMSFWEAVSYDHNRPCPTCEVALSFLVPPLGKAFAARDFAYTVATGTPAGKLEAIQQFLLMTAVESRLRQPVLTPGSGGGWTLTPPTGAVTAEFSLPRLDMGRIGFAGGGSTLQPRLAWSMAAIPVNVGGAVSALNAWGSNWILAGDKPDVFERYGSAAEAAKAQSDQKLSWGTTEDGKPLGNQQEKWIGEVESVQAGTLGQAGNYTHKIVIETQPGTRELLRSLGVEELQLPRSSRGKVLYEQIKVIVKDNEPNRYGITRSFIEEFNNRILRIIVRPR